MLVIMDVISKVMILVMPREEALKISKLDSPPLAMEARREGNSKGGVSNGSNPTTGDKLGP